MISFFCVCFCESSKALSYEFLFFFLLFFDERKEDLSFLLSRKYFYKKFILGRGKNFFINILSPNSYRLELMRQIYNTAESPEMTTFQMMDVSSSAGNNASDVKVLTRTETAVVAPSSTNRNTLRLSLANLLPSRLAIFMICFIRFGSDYLLSALDLSPPSTSIFIFK